MKLASVAVVLFSAAACLAPGPSPSAEDVPAVRSTSSEFGDRVIEIDKAMGDNFFGTILGYDSLRGYRPFNDLALNARDDITGFGEFVSNAHPTHQQITIAILSMHTLGLHDYVKFLEKSVHLRNSNLLTAEEFYRALLPGIDWSDVLIKNYRDMEVQRLLNSIADRTDVSSTMKSVIADIISGKAWSDLKSFRENCCTDPPSNK